MGETTKIQWAHHTFNPWRGCTKVSSGCAHCYAEVQAGRNPKVLGVWGPSGSRPIAAEAYWRQPLAWNAAAQEAGERRRVFCASLCDFFEGPETMPQAAIKPVWDARRRVVDLINQTPWLDWLLLTKRPENIMPALADALADEEFGRVPGMAAEWLRCRPNVWIGTSVENQQALNERGPKLQQVPARVLFFSIEPLLGELDLHRGGFSFLENLTSPTGTKHRKLDWIIVGGESGGNARPCNIEHIRRIVRDCTQAGVPVFVKQLGAFPMERYAPPRSEDLRTGTSGLVLDDPKGGDMSEWPEDLRVRQLPEVAA